MAKRDCGAAHRELYGTQDGTAHLPESPQRLERSKTAWGLRFTGKEYIQTLRGEERKSIPKKPPIGGVGGRGFHRKGSPCAANRVFSKQMAKSDEGVKKIFTEAMGGQSRETKGERTRVCARFYHGPSAKGNPKNKKGQGKKRKARKGSFRSIQILQPQGGTSKRRKKGTEIAEKNAATEGRLKGGHSP